MLKMQCVFCMLWFLNIMDILVMFEKEWEGDIRVRVMLIVIVDMIVSDMIIVNKVGEFCRGFFCFLEVLVMVFMVRNGQINREVLDKI